VDRRVKLGKRGQKQGNGQFLFFLGIFKNFRFIFNWRIITLQYCVDSYLHQHQSAIGTHVFPPSWTSFPPPTLSHRSWLSQSSGFGLPASYNKFPLAICFTYGNVYVSTLLSQIIPPSPFLTCPKVCSLCPHLLCCPADRMADLVWEEGDRESSVETYTLPYVKQGPVGICCMTQGAWSCCSVTAKTSGKGWEVGRRFKREGTCVYLWLIDVDVSRNQHNIVK